MPIPDHKQPNDDVLNVTVEDGKYTVKQDARGRLTALRYGQPWRDCCGDGLVYALAAAYQDARDALADIEKIYLDGCDTYANAWRAMGVRANTFLRRTPPAEDLKEPAEMALCEVPHVLLRPGQLYRFVEMPGCAACATAALPFVNQPESKP